jgi:hypothetical protein
MQVCCQIVRINGRDDGKVAYTAWWQVSDGLSESSADEGSSNEEVLHGSDVIVGRGELMRVCRGWDSGAVGLLEYEMRVESKRGSKCRRKVNRGWTQGLSGLR